MLVIRLQRTGRSNTPTYRIVVAEKARPVKGGIIEILGHYLPAQNPNVLETKDERIDHWVKNGAIPSDTVARLLTKKGTKGLDKFIKRYAKQKSKSAEEEQPAAPAPAAAEKIAEQAAPAEAKGEGKKEEPAVEAPREGKKEEAPAPEKPAEKAKTEPDAAS